MAAHGVHATAVAIDGSGDSAVAEVAQRCTCPVAIVPSAQGAEGGEA